MGVYLSVSSVVASFALGRLLQFITMIYMKELEQVETMFDLTTLNCTFPSDNFKCLKTDSFLLGSEISNPQGFINLSVHLVM